MSKIKISEKDKEIEGRIFSGSIKPFGNSAHIPFSKEHLGKNINIVVPSDCSYCWVFSNVELRTFLREGKKAVEKHVGKMKPHLFDALSRIEKNKFSVSDINSICDALEKQSKCKGLITKIRKTYQFK